jgi:hypothetical protein
VQASQNLIAQKTLDLPVQAWLSSARWDIAFIILPAYLTSVLCVLFRSQFESMQILPLWVWVSLVLLVDVAHVYATLFRTYLHKDAFERNRTFLLALPAACWIAGSLLYSLNDLFFWRVLAYLAVFHFIRQQFGFVVLYSRKDPPRQRSFRWLDCACVYIATIYPMLFWHTHMPRNFSWFVAGDFVESVPALVEFLAGILYGAIAVAYIGKEVALWNQTKYFNLPRNLLIVGTALSWWTGIVWLNSDMAFTLTNVVSHGIPYMALVWLYHHRDQSAVPGNRGSIGPSCQQTMTVDRDTDSGLGMEIQTPTNQDDPDSELPHSHRSPQDAGGSSQQNVGGASYRSPQANRSPSRLLSTISTVALSHVLLFLVFLVVLAYLEEGLWDGLIWREHLTFFQPFAFLPPLNDSALLALIVPFLALPQSTHYVLDGFIWRVKDQKNVWSA